MAQHTVRLIRKNDTITIYIDRYVASFNAEFMDKSDVYEAIKWEAITANVTLNEETLIRLTQDAMVPA
jgi:hypothetical protein